MRPGRPRSRAPPSAGLCAMPACRPRGRGARIEMPALPRRRRVARKRAGRMPAHPGSPRLRRVSVRPARLPPRRPRPRINAAHFPGARASRSHVGGLRGNPAEGGARDRGHPARTFPHGALLAGGGGSCGYRALPSGVRGGRNVRARRSRSRAVRAFGAPAGRAPACRPGIHGAHSGKQGAPVCRCMPYTCHKKNL